MRTSASTCRQHSVTQLKNVCHVTSNPRNTAVLLILLQSRLPRLAEFFMVVVNAEGALGGYPRLRLIVKTRGEGEGELSISLVP